MRSESPTAPNEDVWRVRPWCREAKIAPSTFYALPLDMAPESVTVGRARFILESPYKWLRRVGQAV